MVSDEIVEDDLPDHLTKGQTLWGVSIVRCLRCGSEGITEEYLIHRAGCPAPTENEDSGPDDEVVTDDGTAHERAVAALPEFLEYTGDGTVRCTDCGVTGLRPIGHTDDCAHDYTPTREREGDR